MSVQPSDLAVRRHERYGCDLAAHFAVAPASAEAVKLARSAGDGKGWIAGHIVDCSLGGLGLRSNLFLPIGCVLRVRLGEAEAKQIAAGPLEFSGRIQRTVMLDRTPSFYLGTSFDQTDAAATERLTALLAWLKDSGAPLVPEKSRA